jgi:hypothetical protein
LALRLRIGFGGHWVLGQANCGQYHQRTERQANMALCETDIFSSFVKAGFGYAATVRRFSASIGSANNFSSRVGNVAVASPSSGQFGGD